MTDRSLHVIFAIAFTWGFAWSSMANDDLTSTPIADGSTELRDQLLASERIVFLGDSNTHAGEFIVQIEAALLDEFGAAPEMINLGLSSETCCGLSEPIHPFPRPNVLERLDRVLEKTKPTIVVSCYGMNDGIYHPMDQERFAAYQAGTHAIVKKVKQSGAKLILLTPPPFDPLPYRLAGKLAPIDADEFSWKTIYEDYDSDVIEKYAAWILQQSDDVLAVVDTHGPLKRHLTENRKSNPKYVSSKDGVHFNQQGHQVFASAILDQLGFAIPLSENKLLLELVRKRQSISHLAWLSEVGHLRPGVTAGLTLQDAESKITPLSDRIQSVLSEK